MKRQIDHFLLGLLWLLASTLGVSFWFNTRFGFNIFSAPHWEYFGGLQASATPISALFYVSMFVSVLIMLGGLYLIIRPRFRKIRIGVAAQPNTDNVPVDTPAVPQPTPEFGPIAPARPPRLILPRTVTNPVNTAIAPIAAPTTQTDQIENFQELEDIFTDAGYIVKKPPRIAGTRPALFAIGTDETLWIGAVGAEPSTFSKSVEKLREIFIETLEDIQIHINAFIIEPKSDNNPVQSPVEILRFDTAEQLREYMDNNKNRQLPDSDRDDFNAYSDYIDTVIDYFNKT